MASWSTGINDQRQNPALEGNRPAGAARRIAKLHGEYRVAGLPSLTLLGGLSTIGERWEDAANTATLAGYTLVNAGARYSYTVDAGDHPVTLRLNVNNLMNRRYWVNGSFLGAPRSVVLSASMKF